MVSAEFVVRLLQVICLADDAAHFYQTGITRSWMWRKEGMQKRNWKELQRGRNKMDHELISTYSREQAIEDGMLIDVTETAKEAGFKVPVAITRELWFKYINPSEKLEEIGQSWEGRLWDVLWMLLTKIKAGNKNTSYLTYSVYFLTSPRRKKLVELWSDIGPGDNGEPVMTIMLPEDY